MEGFLSISGYEIIPESFLSYVDIVDPEEKEKVDRIWNASMAPRGFAVTDGNGILQELFEVIAAEFANVYHVKVPIRLVEGYIAKDGGKTYVKHNDMPRVFAQENTVYVDLLISSVLWNYAVVFYTWARCGEKQGIPGKCFKLALYTLDACCRRGVLSESDGIIYMNDLVIQNLDDTDIVTIGDLYWSMLAFALCHEIAHIYSNQLGIAAEGNREKEFEADERGYKVFLGLMVKYMHSQENTVTSIFREYLYGAPMILMLFYHDLFTTGYFLHGETITDTHPNLMERIERLLDISQEPDPDFDTRDGNIVLREFYGISDAYIEELFYKLKNGKLESIVRKGSVNVAKKGLEEAQRVYDEICAKIKSEANRLGYDSGKMIGLWNVACDVDADDAGELNGLVFQVRDKTYSAKGINIVFNQKVALEAIIEMGLTVTQPADIRETIRLAFYIIFKIAQTATLEIDEKQARILEYCHISNAYSRPIPEEVLIDNVPECDHDVLTALDRLGCIEIMEGMITLREKVIYHV